MGVHLPKLRYHTVAALGVVFCGGYTTLDTVTGFLDLLVCGQVDVYYCVLLFVPFGPWLSDKGCKKRPLTPKSYSIQPVTASEQQERQRVKAHGNLVR